MNNINNVFLGVVNRAENDDSDNSDDAESQSIDTNATTIDNHASDDVATCVRFNTRVKSKVKAREERTYIYIHIYMKKERAWKRLQRTRYRNLESVASSSTSSSSKY